MNSEFQNRWRPVYKKVRKTPPTSSQEGQTWEKHEIDSHEIAHIAWAFAYATWIESLYTK